MGGAAGADAAGPPATDASGRPRLTLSGVVRSSEFLGEFTGYLVAVGTHPITTDQSHLAGRRRVEDGATATLAVPAEQLRVLR